MTTENKATMAHSEDLFLYHYLIYFDININECIPNGGDIALMC